MSAPDIRDLAIIGDRRTAALVSRAGSVVWYCPGRFDRPALLTALLDPERGGSWTISIGPDAVPVRRRYLEESGVLETTLEAPAGEWTVTDFMPLGDGLPRGLCRRFSPAPGPAVVTLRAAPDYGRRGADLRVSGDAVTGGGVTVDGTRTLYASHPLELSGDTVRFTLPAGETGWAFLADEPLAAPPDAEAVEGWLAGTLEAWRERAARTTYRGPYELEVAASLRALRLLSFEENGGIVGAATTGLPEVVGGSRNYDYRYVWLRDAGMIVSALTRAGGDPHEGKRFLDFVAATRRPADGLPLAPLSTLSGEPAPAETTLELPGYAGSAPVRLGNGAGGQLQLDAYGNVLVAAKLLYAELGTLEHWDLVAEVADFLAENWREPDHGLWEEETPRHYTSGKVVAACGLEFIANYSGDEAQARRWRGAAQDVRRFIAENCLTPEGAYAAVAGGQAVDVSAALFSAWAFTEPDTPEMRATMAVLERDHADGLLYRRHLTEFDAKQEGAFLAGTLWVAQYWIARGDLERGQKMLDAVLGCANDLFLFSEEADPKSGRMLGNFPQSFVHAAFIGAVVDLKAALEGQA